MKSANYREVVVVTATEFKQSFGKHLDFVEAQNDVVLASPDIAHQELLGRLHLIFNEFFQDQKCRVFFAPFDVHFHKKGFKEPDVMQPDLLVACDLEGNITEKGRYMGTPALVLEILSERTKTKDMIDKLNSHRLSGVGEYWIVDPRQENIMVYAFADHEIDKYRVHGKGSAASSMVFPGLGADVDSLFSNLLGDRV